MARESPTKRLLTLCFTYVFYLFVGAELLVCMVIDATTGRTLTQYRARTANRQPPPLFVEKDITGLIEAGGQPIRAALVRVVFDNQHFIRRFNRFI